MLDLNFEVKGAKPERFAAAPLLRFRLRIGEAVSDGAAATSVQAIVLYCQIRIEPARRQYSAMEKERLEELFGSTERWGQTVRPMFWTHASAVVKPFSGSTEEDLPVPCSYDFTLAATRYFDALDQGELPLGFYFNGTIFYESAHGGLQVAQVPWDREAYFRLPVSTWKELTEAYYPNTAWLCLRKDVFDQLDGYRSRQGLASVEQTLETLLAEKGETGGAATHRLASWSERETDIG